MSADDDDDFWDNEDFVATIENVVKKAEEASAAAKQEGTQFGAPTPGYSTIVPSQTISSGIKEASPSIQGTPHLHESLISRPSNGLTAPSPREAFPGAAFRYGEHANLEHKRNPGSFATPHRLGQQKIPLQSVIYHRPSLLTEEVPKDVHSPHQSSQGGLWRAQPPGGTGGAVEESGRYRELMAEKDGAISVLRARVSQAELQLDDLRKRVGPQSAPHPSLNQQQLELDRLSAQLLFKDHEVVEAQRACVEKEERLKDALTETVALKGELERLRNSRQTGAEFKRPRDEGDVEVAEKNSESCELTPAVQHVSVRNTTGVSKHSHDPWSPPWVPEGNLNGAQGNTTAGLPAKILKGIGEMDGCQRLQAKSPTVEALKLRTGGNGCVLSDGRESLQRDKGQANEVLKRDIPRTAGTSMAMRAEADGSGACQGLNSFSRTSEMYYSLQQLWGFKGVRNEGISLLFKLYASCRQDLYILLSHGESQDSSSPHKHKEHQTDSETVSEQLHMALSKIAVGSAHPEIIIAPLLEFCKLDNINFVGSALHILRCILQHDSTCRQKLLLRGSQDGPDSQVPSLASCEILEKPEKSGERKRWFSERVPKGNPTSQVGQVVVFSSRRILCCPEARENHFQQLSGERDPIRMGVDKGGHEAPMPSDKVHQPAQEGKETRSEDNSVPLEDLNLLVKWMLQLAMTTSNRNVKFEAVAIIGLLVASSNPLVERSMFGPLLCHGRIDRLLKESARAEIQLQAVRIVHLLFHCPTVFRSFCFVAEEDQSGMLEPKCVNEKDPDYTEHLQKRAEKLPVNGQNDEIADGQDLGKSKIVVTSAPQQSSYPELSKVKLLEGMTECLKYTGNSLQGRALHRSVIRLLTFIATSGDSGAATLLQAGASHEDPELGQPSKEDTKIDRVMGGESGSGQQIVGNGSSSIHLKGLDPGDRGSGIPIGLVNESVEDLESVQNIPQRLVALIDLELDAEEREGWNEPSIGEERDLLIREAVTLLCHLSSHAVQSPSVIGHLISNKDMARLTLGVTNRLVTRKSRAQQSGSGQKPTAPRNSDIADLARGLRRRVLATLADSRVSLRVLNQLGK